MTASLSPRRNRVSPFGRIEATRERGALMGNRGILHDGAGPLRERLWQHRNWIACQTSFKGRSRTLGDASNYTVLFFTDEAVAFAAGHRPCAECRRADYNRFRDFWRKAQGLPDDRPLKAPDIDAALHAARIAVGRQVTHEAALAGLPDGTFLAIDGAALMLWQGSLHPWTSAGYGAPVRRPSDRIVTVLTPQPIVATFAAGYVPGVAGGL